MSKRVRFSEQLRAAVDAAGMSRYRICKEIGIKQASMSRFMAGGWLSMQTADALAVLLDLHVTTGKHKKGR